jgi:hypothetical protein
MGRGFPIVTSTKQKLNTSSSTESELVSVDDCMPAICWARYFLMAQGNGVTENIRILYTKTTRVRYCWRRMGKLQAPSARSTSISDFILSPTE